MKATEQNEVIPNYYLLFSFLLFFVLIQCEAAMTHALEIITFALDLLKKILFLHFCFPFFDCFCNEMPRKKKLYFYFQYHRMERINH